jgi:hypothetical protein
MTDPVARLRSLAPGSRVVIRMRIPGGFTDVLGDLEAIDEVDALVLTRRGPVAVPLSSVVLAKPVPPPPVRHSDGGQDRPARRDSRPTS